jgi:hypothetical protein
MGLHSSAGRLARPVEGIKTNHARRLYALSPRQVCCGLLDGQQTPNIRTTLKCSDPAIQAREILPGLSGSQEPDAAPRRTFLGE